MKKRIVTGQTPQWHLWRGSNLVASGPNKARLERVKKAFEKANPGKVYKIS